MVKVMVDSALDDSSLEDWEEVKTDMHAGGETFLDAATGSQLTGPVDRATCWNEVRLVSRIYRCKPSAMNTTTLRDIPT